MTVSPDAGRKPLVDAALIAVAAAGYMLAAELSDPIPQHAVRKLYENRLLAAELRLSTGQRIALAHIADLNAASEVS